MVDDEQPDPSRVPFPIAGTDLESTRRLLSEARGGDRQALERLCERYLPRLRRWAHGRIPPWARGLNDTDDLVIETMSIAVRRVERFEDRGEGAFRALVWKILLGKVADELRRAYRRPPRAEELSDPAAPAPSPEESAIVQNVIDKLPPEDRDMVVAHMIFGLTYSEIAEVTGLSPDAVRMRIARALARVAKGREA